MIKQELSAGYENTLQAGSTVHGGVESFSNQKTKNVLFATPFKVIPSVTVTLDSDSNSIPYALNVTLIGFQIKFRINYTGNASWSASKTIKT